MEATLQRAPAAGAAVWTGRVLSGLVVLFLLFDGGIKVVEMDVEIGRAHV